MPLRRLLTYLASRYLASPQNVEALIQKLSESYPIRRAAQLTAYSLIRAREGLKQVQKNETVSKAQGDMKGTTIRFTSLTIHMSDKFKNELQKFLEEMRRRFPPPPPK